mgnify:CR=1 FL=1
MNATTEPEHSPDAAERVRVFVLVAAPSALVAWQIGFELGAFDVLNYSRVFAVFVVATVVLLATFIAPNSGFASSPVSRLILALPLIYLVADALFLTEEPWVAIVLALAVLGSFPYAIWVAVRLMGFQFFTLTRREQIGTVLAVIVIGTLGWYVGETNDRYLVCRDFERVGDYQPDNCRP